jgi:hypothetical protein
MKKFICLLTLSLCLLSCSSAPALRQPLIKQHLAKQFQVVDIANYLVGIGCDEYEIANMLQISKEVYPDGIGEIHNVPGHFYFQVITPDNKVVPFDNGQTYANCSIYASKRLLRFLGQKGIVDSNLWFAFTDRQWRQLIVGIENDEKYTNQGEYVGPEIFRQLLVPLGVPPEYIRTSRS